MKPEEMNNIAARLAVQTRLTVDPAAARASALLGLPGINGGTLYAVALDTWGDYGYVLASTSRAALQHVEIYLGLTRDIDYVEDYLYVIELSRDRRASAWDIIEPVETLWGIGQQVGFNRYGDAFLPRAPLRPEQMTPYRWSGQPIA